MERSGYAIQDLQDVESPWDMRDDERAVSNMAPGIGDASG